MAMLLEPVLIAALALNFVMLGTSRVRAVIQAVALQGALFGILPILIHADVEARAVFLALAAIGIKGLLIPYFLNYAMREVDFRHEARPIVDFVPSLLLGAIGTALAIVFAGSLPLLDDHDDTLVVPTALATVLTGFLLLTTRKMAINQVLGYLVLENGIFTFGMLLLEAMPFLVEIGVLLDLFTGVFIMGIIIHHVSREFASVSTEFLSDLKEE